MENDVCEPYCLYAHIYTALEKIFGILSQNPEYKRYLDLLVRLNYQCKIFMNIVISIFLVLDHVLQGFRNR